MGAFDLSKRVALCILKSQVIHRTLQKFRTPLQFSTAAPSKAHSAVCPHEGSTRPLQTDWPPTFPLMSKGTLQLGALLMADPSPAQPGCTGEAFLVLMRLGHSLSILGNWRETRLGRPHPAQTHAPLPRARL